MLHDAVLAAIPPATLYGILRLRAEVFVVEQDCVYLDPDGRDLEPVCRHLWIEVDGAVLAAARILDDGDERSIGRIVTAPSARGQGLAARLIEHALAHSEGPWTMQAQSQLVSYYAGFGFEVDGDEFDDDGILHTPMRRGVSGG
jgi:ElaA protein